MTIKLPLPDLTGCLVCEGWKNEMTLESLVKQGLLAGGKAVQLRTDKHTAYPSHPAYKAALDNFADLLVVAGPVLRKEQDFAMQAEHLRSMAASLHNGSLAHISVALGRTADTTEQASPQQCAVCLERAPTIMADACRHVYLCTECFTTQTGSHRGSTSFPCFLCRTVSSHAAVFIS